jgi:hypothetical protein
MSMKKGVLAFMFLVIITSVNAEDFDVEYHAIKDKALVGDEFVFSVTVDNPRDEVDSFRFYSPLTFFEWVFVMEPNTLFIEPDASKTVELSFEPYDVDELEPGNYAITLNLVSNNYSDTFEELVFNVEILSHNQVIDSELELPNTIDTAGDNIFRVRLNNNYDFYVENLSVGLKSEYFDERFDEITLDDEEIEKEFLVNFGDVVEVGETDIHVLVYSNDKLVVDRVETISISASGDVKEVGTPEKGFLFFKETVEKINDQNAVSFETVTKKLSAFQKLFTSVNEEPTSIVKEGNFYIYTWEFSLEPSEGKIILIETDYRVFVYSFLALILVIWLAYLYFKKDLSLSKRILSIQHSKENISTISVLLVLRNKTLGKVKNVKLMDGMVNVIEKPSNFGSVQPLRVMKGEKGTKMLWEIPIVDPGAEIAISYTVKVKAKVIGNLPVPSAIAKYIKSKRRRLVKSNKITMFS